MKKFALVSVVARQAGVVSKNCSGFPAHRSLHNDVGNVELPGGTKTAALLKDISDDPGHHYHPGSGACQTNTFAALHFASQLEALKDPTRGNYAMLITDGEATCLNETRWPLMGSLAQIDTLLGEMSSAGLPTYVIGFGDAVDPIALASHATAAGTQRDTEPAYYQADSAEELDEAIRQIAGSIVSCDFSLDSQPPNQEELYVFFDDEERLEPDENNGWVLSGQTLSFRGSACARLRSHEVEDVDVVFGCPEPVTK